MTNCVKSFKDKISYHRDSFTRVLFQHYGENIILSIAYYYDVKNARIGKNKKRTLCTKKGKRKIKETYRMPEVCCHDENVSCEDFDTE